MTDIAVLQEVAHLIHHHHGTVVLGLLRGGTEVRQGNDALVVFEQVARKIADVTVDLADLDGGRHRGIVNDAFAREVEQHHARLHQLEALGVDHVAGFVAERHVESDEIGIPQQLVDAGGAMHAGRQLPGALHRQAGIETDHLHAQTDGGIGHVATD